ncbi:3-oxoacyl-(acyl-carrier-protein) synthase III [Thermodesulfatator indicus DSM 15286]|uniref:Beta-ketoacyl-[acyl-carrier-protein] synthase III n=1 Tax=Thermodesulfatator indicus (strain DSM 15286 / JCM 11887 / CIR29812) TaxID=667014 RepID=F8ABI1_THEID|nr:beta-ketoacyl-ACP synthase III [Thermodesulfatator indicus]AEH45578.1 3-oxoacyl-(acyl-carrier-protein) synthase III [Thermodesulfatator indicus DSM 15286]
MKTGAMFKGLGVALPSRVLTNQDLEKMVDTSDEWITQRTGIKERHIVGPGESNSKLAVEAAKKALAKAEIAPEELDLIIVATLTPDYLMPSVAVLVQDQLGAKNAGAFDVAATCSGFIYGVSIADQFIRVDPSKKILVIGSEVLSHKVNWEDRTTCVLFGDGAGAAVLTGPEDNRGVLSTHLHADGSLWHLLTIKGCGSLYPPCSDDLPREEYFIRMQGREVFKHAVRAMEEVALEALQKNNCSPDDLALVVPHQANIRIIEALRERLGLPREKVYVNVHKYGNTSAASIPLALAEAEEEGRLKPGNLVLLVAFGGGFTWASALIRW